MLVIRKEQKDALVAAKLSDFERKVIRHVSSKYPDVYWRMPEKEKQSTVRTAIVKGGEYQLDSEAEIIAYVELEIEDDAFLKEKKAIRVLDNPAISQEGKIKALELLRFASTGSL